MEFLDWAIAIGLVRIVDGKVDIESVIEAFYRFEEGGTSSDR